MLDTAARDGTWVALRAADLLAHGLLVQLLEVLHVRGRARLRVVRHPLHRHLRVGARRDPRCIVFVFRGSLSAHRTN